MEKETIRKWEKESNEGNNIIIKEKDKEYYILGGFPDFVLVQKVDVN